MKVWHCIALFFATAVAGYLIAEAFKGKPDSVDSVVIQAAVREKPHTNFADLHAEIERLTEHAYRCGFRDGAVMAFTNGRAFDWRNQETEAWERFQKEQQ